MKLKTSSLFASLFMASSTLGIVPASPAAESAGRINNVVLVHGGFVDGSGWEIVYKLLKARATTSGSSRTPRHPSRRMSR